MKNSNSYKKTQREIAKLLERGLLTEPKAIAALSKAAGYDFGGSQNSFKIVRDLLDEIAALKDKTKEEPATAYVRIVPTLDPNVDAIATAQLQIVLEDDREKEKLKEETEKLKKEVEQYQAANDILLTACKNWEAKEVRDEKERLAKLVEFAENHIEIDGKVFPYYVAEKVTVERLSDDGFSLVNVGILAEAVKGLDNIKKAR